MHSHWEGSSCPQWRGPQVSPSTQGYDRCLDREAQPDTNGGGLQLSVGPPSSQFGREQNPTGVPRADRAAATGQLVGSASFPRDPGSQRMIDYRHFVPQMPFVPAVAKSIPERDFTRLDPRSAFVTYSTSAETRLRIALTGNQGTGLVFSQGPIRDWRAAGHSLLPLGEELGLVASARTCLTVSSCPILPLTSAGPCVRTWPH